MREKIKMSRSHRFALEKVLELRHQETLKALQQHSAEERKLAEIHQDINASQVKVQEAFESFHHETSTPNTYDYGIHFPLYIQQQRNYEAKLLQDASRQQQVCEVSKTLYIQAKIREKSLEKLKEKKALAFQAKQAHRDSLEMDEMGLRQFRQ
jgi:flagellar export protein FliJ